MCVGVVVCTYYLYINKEIEWHNVREVGVDASDEFGSCPPCSVRYQLDEDKRNSVIFVTQFDIR